MTPVSEWTEDRAEAQRWADALRKTVRYAFARIIITQHIDGHNRKHYRVEASR